MLAQQLAVVLGPVALGAVLGPILLALMDRAKRRAETENLEVLAEKARFEAMDILITHLRTEMDRLLVEATTCRERVTTLERRLRGRGRW